MTTLRHALQSYIKMRRGLGYKYVIQAHRLSSFVTFMEQRDTAIITTKLALEWATLPYERYASWAIRTSDVRGFTRYLQCLEPATEIPPMGIITYRCRYRPYIYTETETQKLMAAALSLPPEHALRRWTYHCLFGLLAVTGMRIGEALRLRCEDVDLNAGIITVHKSKFGKSRALPLHVTTQRALSDYVLRRDAHHRTPCSPYFLVAEQGGKLLPQYVYLVFQRLLRETGVRDDTAHQRPRLHDFRHSFAVATLLAWYRSEQNVDILMPVLSNYLGHSCIRYTYWYLSACPELMGPLYGGLSIIGRGYYEERSHFSRSA